MSTPAATEEGPDYALFFGSLGIAIAISFSAIGSAYATAKAGVAVSVISIMRPELIMKSMLPVIMGGIVAIYGLVISILLSLNFKTPYSAYTGFVHFSSGLSVGLCGIASGMAIGIVGDAGLRAMAQQQRIFIGLIIMLVFAEVLGLFGLIVACLMAVK